MARDFNDDELRAVRIAFDDEETPTAPQGVQLGGPRGWSALRSTRGDAFAGELIGADTPTPDPPDLKFRRVMPQDPWRGR